MNERTHRSNIYRIIKHLEQDLDKILHPVQITEKAPSPRDPEDQDEDEYEYESRAGTHVERGGGVVDDDDDDDDEGP